MFEYDIFLFARIIRFISSTRLDLILVHDRHLTEKILLAKCDDFIGKIEPYSFQQSLSGNFI